METKNPFVQALLTDRYQITMAYVYFKSKRHEEKAVFDLFFRNNPFDGEFTVFAGLSEVLRYLDEFVFTDDDIEYLENEMPGCEPEFFEWLRNLDCKDLKIFAAPEGTLMFSRSPLMRIEGPLGIAQIVETTLLNLVNFSSLVATNAVRHRLAVGNDKTLLEFGLRRAQGPDGAVSASRYSYMGGFNGTSNFLAGKLYGIPVKGTHAHSLVQSFSSLEEVTDQGIDLPSGEHDDTFVQSVLETREKLGFERTHDGELAAFITYAQSFPDGFLALVDTYNTLESGVPNFICVALALFERGYSPLGIRLDSGDLAFLSRGAREIFVGIGEQEKVPFLASSTIVASNDINEEVIYQLIRENHEIDAFGIGTHLVTCQRQPALGCVYKLVSIAGKSRIKLSQEVSKITIPGRKDVYRLYGRDGFPVVDLMVKTGARAPKVGERVLCRHPFDRAKRAYIVPTRVEPLLRRYWNGKICEKLPTIHETRAFVLDQVSNFRDDHLRFVNPTPYKVSVSEGIFDEMQKLWSREAPIGEIE